MNCPFHIGVYKQGYYSYRDLPLRWAELGTGAGSVMHADLLRDEKTSETCSVCARWVE